jgi:hypothetical protein
MQSKDMNKKNAPKKSGSALKELFFVYTIGLLH